MTTAPNWPTQQAGDHRKHIRLEVVGGQLKTGALEDALQKSFDAGFALGEKRTREKLTHPALASTKAATNNADGYKALVQSHLETLRSKKR